MVGPKLLESMKRSIAEYFFCVMDTFSLIMKARNMDFHHLQPSGFQERQKVSLDKVHLTTMPCMALSENGVSTLRMFPSLKSLLRSGEVVLTQIILDSGTE